MGASSDHDELDAVLDGRRGVVSDELAPLAAAAEALRAELHDVELDPAVAGDQLRQLLGPAGARPAAGEPQPFRPLQPAPVTPARRHRPARPGRRRLALGLLAAAFLLVWVVVASSAALPGQPLYPVKLAADQTRLAVASLSPAATARERTRIADERLRELQALGAAERYDRIPAALRAVDRSVAAAQAAVQRAERDGVDQRRVATLRRKLAEVQDQKTQQVAYLRRRGWRP